MSVIFEDIKTTSGFNFKKLLGVTSNYTLFAALLISFACPRSFYNLQQAIYQGLPPNVSDLHKFDMFDVQYFYTPASAKTTLDGWGDQGIQFFYIIAFIDVFVFCFGYRALFVIAVNRLFNFLSADIPKQVMSRLRYLVYLPMVVTLVDYVEDTAQVAMCLVYQAYKGQVSESSQTWVTVVEIASKLNLLKWIVALSGLVLYAIFLFIAFVCMFKRALGPTKKE